MRILAILLFLAGPAQSEAPTEKVTVIGRVVNSADGAPLPFGNVAIYQDSGKIHNLRIDAGEFSGAVPAGEGYSLTIRVNGFADFHLNNVNVYRGMPPFTLELRPVWPVKGQVVDPQGRGVAGARVGLSLDADGANIPLVSVTDDRGSFHMAHPLDPGVYYLLAVKVGYQQPSPMPFDYPPTGELRVELNPLDTGETGSISGIATLNREPVAGLEISLIPSADEEIGQAKTDSQGEFYFLDVAPGAYQLALRRDDPSQPVRRLNVEVAAGKSTRAEFALFDGRLSGVVLDLEGAPVHEVLVSLSAGVGEPEPLADNPEERDALQRRNSRKYVFHHTQTDQRGRFSFSGIEAGPYLFRVHSGSRTGYLEQTMSVEVPADQDLSIVLEPGLVVRALLLDHDGSVVKTFGYQIGALEDPTSSLSAPVNSLDGLFLIRGLKPALYWFNVNLEDGRKARGLVDLNRGVDILFQMPSAEGAELGVSYKRP